MSLVLSEFGIAQGWKVDKHPHGTFQPAKFVLNNFGVQQGWQVSKHPRFVVDLTGDNRADIIGFGDSDVYLSYNDGKGGFGAIKTLISAFAYNNGEWLVDL